MSLWKPLLISPDDAQQLRAQRDAETLPGSVLRENIAALETFMAQPAPVPGHGEAGGAEHHQHKQNYVYINLAGRLF